MKVQKIFLSVGFIGLCTGLLVLRNQQKNTAYNPVSERFLEMPLAEEWRVLSIHDGDTVQVELLDGSAEVFGVPLTPGRPYVWGRGDKFAVFTWYGCQLKVSGLGGGVEGGGSTVGG
ncbi:MAG: hypothetical protein NWQ43_03175, partial [Dolichospermum sp.]|nr:hypothetical protein [Dolichospermum sp.]